MPSSQELFEMSQADITKIDILTLRDINTITIDQELPHEEKVWSYITQMGNPYCFISGGVPVRMRFMAEDKSLSQSLVTFFSQLKER